MTTTIRAPGRHFTLTTDHDSTVVEFGPGGTNAGLSTLVMQIVPDGDWSGSLTVKGRIAGQDAEAVDPVGIPYHPANVGGTASDYALVSSAITGDALIQIPSNGLTVSLDVTASAGTCEVFVWDLQGNSAP